MKNKLLLVLIVVCLVLSVCLSVGCSGIMDKISEVVNNGDKDGDDKTNDSTSSFEYQASAVSSQLETMKNANGYLLRYEVTGDDSEAGSYTNVSVGAKGNIYYASDDTNEYFFDVSDDTCFVEYDKLEGQTWNKTIYYYDQEAYTKDYFKNLMDVNIAARSGWLTYYEAFTASMGDDVQKSTGSIVGRSCDVFTFSAAALVPGAGISMARATYVCYVDKATSICLKWEYTFSNNGQSESWSVECKEFNTNPTLTLPTVGEENTYVHGTKPEQGQQGGQGQGGDDESEGTQTYTKTLATRESIEAAIGSTYKVSADSTFGGGETTSASDGVYNYYTNPYAIFSKNIGDMTYTYGSLRDGKYRSISSPVDSIVDPLGFGNVQNIFIYAGESISYQSEKASTYLDRPVTIYTYKTENANGYDMSYEETLIIDDATGACLKHESQGYASDGFMGGSQKPSFLVTEFEYGENNAAARELLDEYIAKIDIFEWDVDFIEQIGLSEIAAPDWMFWSASWEYSSSRDSEYPEYATIYHFLTDDAAGTVDEVREFVLSFYNAGAKLNDYGVEESFDDLCYFDDEDYDFFFDAYVDGNPSYKVSVYAKFQKYNTPKSWLITVDMGIEE